MTNKSYQRKLCEEICEIVEKDEEIRAAGNVVAFCEDKFDPATKVTENAKTKVRVMIATTGHERKPGTGASTSGDVGLEITVFENPLTRKDDAITLTGASERIAAILHWRNVLGSSRIRYLSMARADADERDYRMVILFAVELPLDPRKAVRWGTGEGIFLGEVVTKRTARGGVNVYEPNRSGDDTFVGTRNRHWTVALSCSVKAEITEEDLPEFGSTFTVGGRTYLTEGAELVESGEDSATVNLTGRTLPSAQNNN